MSKRVVKSSSSKRRHNFSSFKERIDATKIEPNLKLLVRPYDEVDTSHFRSTLDHWNEINLSGNFTDFVAEVDPYCQTLPQIIHHQKHIFHALSKHIGAVDPFSLEPLLELLSQFIHDLGPDFMIFYSDAISLLSHILLKLEPNESQNNRNSSNVIEWCFNCLAFAFKYLTRSLVRDLTVTFEAMMPLLESPKKQYLSRFGAEALSYLIRKQPEEFLEKTISYTFTINASRLESSQTYRDALVVLYGEAMKGTEGTYHSKSMLTLHKIITYSFAMSTNQQYASQIVSKLIILLINHGCVTNSSKIYVTVLLALRDSAKQSSLILATTYLISLAFADSGKKISSWRDVVQMTESISRLAASVECDSSTLHDSLVYLYCIIMRNASTSELMKYFRTLSSCCISLDGGKYFFAFVEICYHVAKDASQALGIVKSIQNFINMESTYHMRIPFAQFLANPQNTDLSSSLAIPLKLSDAALTDLLAAETTDDNLPILCSSLQILRILALTADKMQQICSKLPPLLDSGNEGPERALAISLIIDIASSKSSLVSDELRTQIFEQICIKFDIYKGYVAILSTINGFFGAFPISKAPIQAVKTFAKDIISNFSNGSRDCRVQSANLMFAILHSMNQKSLTLSNIMEIEQTPLTIDCSRDLTSKIRALFAILGNSEYLEWDVLIMDQYIFGLLTIKFQPCWEAVLECIPHLPSQFYAGVYAQSLEFLCKSYDSVFASDKPDFRTLPASQEVWLPRDSRLLDNYGLIYEKFISSYLQALTAYEFMIRDSDAARYSPLMRSRAILVLKALPSISAEDLLNLASMICTIMDGEDNDSGGSMGSHWTMAERNLFISIFSKAKNFRKLKDDAKLYKLLLKLLSSRLSEGQRLALDAIFNFHFLSVNKYRDHLQNLLDDALFRDEVMILFASGSESIIEAPDYLNVVNLALHILFGRAQRSYKSNSEIGKKKAVFQTLASLGDDEISIFLEIGAKRLNYEPFFLSHDLETTVHELRRCLGFYNLLLELIDVLNPSKLQVLIPMVKPIIYGMVLAQHYLLSENVDGIDLKTAKQVRLIGLKCFVSVVKFLGESGPWQEFTNIIFEYVLSPRLAKFSEENMQLPSTLLGSFSILIEYLSTRPILYQNDNQACDAIVSLLANPHTKSSAVASILDFCFKSLAVHDNDDEELFRFLAILIDGVIANLPRLILESGSETVIEKSVRLLLQLVSENYIEDASTRSNLVTSLISALDVSTLNKDQTFLVLQSVALLLEKRGLRSSQLMNVYMICSKRLRTTKERDQRQALLKIFFEVGEDIDKFSHIATLLAQINSVTVRHEPNFEERLAGFRELNEGLYLKLDVEQWMPILYCALYYINDELELTLRTNSAFTICRYVDAFSSKSNEDAKPLIQVLKDVILPHIRLGLRSRNFDVQSEYVSIIAHLVEKAHHYDEMDDLKVLLFNNDDEANFFRNVNHIQLHRRQRAIIRIRDYREHLKSSNIAHYILPMIENYVITNDEKLRNLSNESVRTISFLAQKLSWTQFNALFMRYISMLKIQNDETLSTRTSLIVAASSAAFTAIENYRLGNLDNTFTNIPSQDTIDAAFSSEILPRIVKVLAVRNDDTVVARIQLGEAIVNCLLCVSSELRSAHLSGALTALCQILRSRSEELRDAVRKTLGRIILQLGSEYLLFICKELKTALSRGSQIHVLSFTLHYLVSELSMKLTASSLDESCSLIVDTIMEDIFGTAGQEKDAEGYHSKMKEVKHKKSYDTAEILSSFIGLESFEKILNPVKLILKENASLNIQKKVDELLRRYALGLNRNEEASSQKVLLLSYEVYGQSLLREEKQTSHNRSENHFLVSLTRDSKNMETDRTFYVSTLQKFSLEMFRTAIVRHESLRTVGNCQGFLEYLQNSVSVVQNDSAVSAYKILVMLITLPFKPEHLNPFKAAMRKAIANIKNSPTVESELSQVCLRYLSAVVRHRPQFEIKESTIGYLLTRILPSLEDSSVQGNAFNFVKAVTSQHILIPEIYDLMDKVSKIMVVNHHRDVRNMARGVYLIFLMEYDQGKGRLQKQFKFLINNLGYSTQEGRQSVMELLNSIVMRGGPQLIDSVATSFFVALSNVTVSDDSKVCREMANSILKSLMGRVEEENLQTFRKYCSAWMSQAKNDMLMRCGLNVYNIFIQELGFGYDKELDDLAISHLARVFSLAKNTGEVPNETIGWEMVYSLLITFSIITEVDCAVSLTEKYSQIWRDVFSVLLFPHPWVRLVASRLVGIFITHMSVSEFEVTNYELQTVAYRLLRQLAAPSISDSLGNEAFTNLTHIITLWQKNFTPYELSEDFSEAKYQYAVDFAVTRICGLLRQDVHQQIFVKSKKYAVKLLRVITSQLTTDYLLEQSFTIILALVNLIETLGTSGDDDALRALSQELLQDIEHRLGVSDYTAVYSKVQNQIDRRRQDRKLKRAQSALNAPEAFAKRKLKKHEKVREKRKHEKDENGYYKPKGKRLAK